MNGGTWNFTKKAEQTKLDNTTYQAFFDRMISG